MARDEHIYNKRKGTKILLTAKKGQIVDIEELQELSPVRT